MVGFSKATYMYWQKRFDRENPNKELEDKILEIHSDNKDFGYRRIHAMLRKQGYVVNKKRVQRIMQKLLTEIPKHMDEHSFDFCEDLLPWSDKLPAKCRK